MLSSKQRGSSQTILPPHSQQQQQQTMVYTVAEVQKIIFDYEARIEELQKKLKYQMEQNHQLRVLHKRRDRDADVNPMLLGGFNSNFSNYNSNGNNHPRSTQQVKHITQNISRQNFPEPSQSKQPGQMRPRETEQSNFNSSSSSIEENSIPVNSTNTIQPSLQDGNSITSKTSNQPTKKQNTQQNQTQGFRVQNASSETEEQDDENNEEHVAKPTMPNKSGANNPPKNIPNPHLYRTASTANALLPFDEDKELAKKMKDSLHLEDERETAKKMVSSPQHKLSKKT